MARFSWPKPAFKLPKFTFVKNRVSKITPYIRKRPMVSFVVALLILLALIAAGNFFQPKPQTIVNTNPAKQVQIYTIGSVPKVASQAQIQNSGVITITALTP